MEEFKRIRTIFKREMKRLAAHENKDAFYGQVAINSCYTRMLNPDMQLYQMFTPHFLVVIEQYYLNALKENPECFGTYDAKDVIHALYLQACRHGFTHDENSYAEYLSKECFCLLICKNKDKLLDNVLRIDLFRSIKESKVDSGCFEFVGGIFHALKHYSIEEQCASICPNQNVILYDVEQLIWPIAKAFFEDVHVQGNRVNTFEASTTYLNKTMTLVFYNEMNNNVSFVNSLIPKSMKDSHFI